MRLAAVGFVTLIALDGCAPSTLAVSTDAPDTAIFVDGRHAPTPSIAPTPYYGTVAVDLAPGESPRELAVRDPIRRLVEIGPPAPEWIFPFDLAVEAVHRLFTGPDWYTVHASLPTRPGVVDEVTPARTPELRMRADQLRLAR